MSVAHIVESSTNVPTTVPKKVKVRIKEGDDGMPTIECSHPLGLTDAIIGHLPSSKMVKRATTMTANYGGNLKDIIRRCGDIIPKDVWAGAIGAEIICRMGAAKEAECEMSAVANGAYLALNDSVYRLSPVECLPVNRVMSSVRRLVIDKAKVETERITKEGQAQANKILALAENRMAEVTVERDNLARERRGAMMPPQELAIGGVTLVNTGSGTWKVGFVVTIHLTHFEFKYPLTIGASVIRVKRWPAATHTPYTVLLWVPLLEDGRYGQRTIGVDAHFYQLPHVKWNASCMDLGGAPPALKSAAHVSGLANAFAVCMRKVELNSLYVAAHSWSPQHQAAIPEIIKQQVLAGTVGNLSRDEFAAPEREDINVQAEASETWNVR